MTKEKTTIKSSDEIAIKPAIVEPTAIDSKVVIEEEFLPMTEMKEKGYYEACGRRKTSVARIRLFTQGEKDFVVNKKPVEVYFPGLELQQIVKSPLEKMKCLDKFKISVLVKGGGVHSQAEAVRHGLSRALVVFNPEFKKRLRKAEYLTRDPRMRERKKFGLKRARRAPQWAKR